MTGSLNKKKKKRKLAAEVPPGKDVDVLLKKRVSSNFSSPIKLFRHFLRKS